MLTGRVSSQEGKQWARKKSNGTKFSDAILLTESMEFCLRNFIVTAIIYIFNNCNFQYYVNISSGL